MPKIIVFCADGTWNGPGEPDDENTAAPPTNVFKLFLNLAGTNTPDTALLADEQERVLLDAAGNPLQCSKYLHGVGDSSNFLVQLLGGTVGSGLIARIVRGYTYISRNYLAGDRIYITGFSRGAYTARALAGMIARMGLLDATQLDLTDKQAAYRLGSSVWYAYRQAALQDNPDWLSRLVDVVNDLPGFFQKPVPAGQSISAPIEAVAVWDTVGSLGIPTYTLQQQRVDLFQFADRKLSPKVNHGIHAVAVDEQRADFTPTLWDPDPARIVQMLFPGCHSDVGGGFVGPGPESGLSDATLQWMTDRLAERGVMFQSPPVYVGKPDCCGTAHATWLTGIWQVLPRSLRKFGPDIQESSEVVGREQADAVIPYPGAPACRYTPINLPPGASVA
jgi:uncharacterized protein (DUF2235 family)